MLIPPKYILTPRIAQLLQSIEASREVISSLPIPPELENNIRRQSTLASSVFSARIEGNTLTMGDLPQTSSRDQRKREVLNILHAIDWIQKRRFKDLKVVEISQLHKLVLDGLTANFELGRFRTETGAIFNAAGIAVYLPPPPRHVPALLNRVVRFINGSKEPLIPIKAALAHYSFEKIHPFLDGNGRVGRLLMQLVVKRGEYDMKGLVPTEKYLDSHRSEYYRALDMTERDVTDYVEFILEALDETAKIAKEQVLGAQTTTMEDYLLPRRAEILNIIKDHKLVNFDIIRRRFMAVNERTLRYDIKKLADSGLVRKRGATKGVWYEPVKQN